MHGTLKSECVSSELNLQQQKMKFSEFQDYYNFERPHEGINQVTPGSIYSPSERIWSGRLTSPIYQKDYKLVKVRVSGQIKFKGQNIFIGRALANEHVGLEETECGHKIYYGPIYLADIDLEGNLNVPRILGRKDNKFKCDFY